MVQFGGSQPPVTGKVKMYQSISQLRDNKKMLLAHMTEKQIFTGTRIKVENHKFSLWDKPL